MNKFLDIFQIINLAFFLVVFTGRTVYLGYTQRINPFALGAGKRGLARLLELLLLPWLVLWMLALLVSNLHITYHPIPALWNLVWFDQLPGKILGVLLILAGDTVFVWALISMGNSWRIGIDKKSAGALVTNGVFAFSRNPIFAFIDLYFVGTFLVNGTLVFLIFTVLTIIALQYQIFQEESFLLSRYGQDYRDYSRQAGRYVNLKAIFYRLDK